MTEDQLPLNAVVREETPGAFTIAQESTSWPLVTADAKHGGLGFLFKWNMGWMHDTLKYFAVDPIGRTWHHDQITFAMVYEGEAAIGVPWADFRHKYIEFGHRGGWSEVLASERVRDGEEA